MMCNAPMIGWQQLYKRATRSLAVDISAGTEPFWRLVIEEAAAVGPAPVIIVPYSRCGADITAAVLRTPSAPLGEFAVPTNQKARTSERSRILASVRLLRGKAS
jgi:hypothetical protein